MSGFDEAVERAWLRTRLAFSRSEVLRVLSSGIESTWAPAPQKLRMRAALAAAAAG
jgi:hypothetical protein